MTRDNILDSAKSIINGERQGTYGEAENSFAIIAQMWTAYLGKDLSSSDVANIVLTSKSAFFSLSHSLTRAGDTSIKCLLKLFMLFPRTIWKPCPLYSTHIYSYLPFPNQRCGVIGRKIIIVIIARRKSDGQ